MKPLLAIALLTAAYIYLLAAVLGVPRGTEHRKASETSVPPRLFLNGEIARIAATGCEVVVQSAVWDAECHCYLYTVTPASEDLTTVSR